MAGSPKLSSHPDEHQLGADVPVNDARNNDSRERDAIRDLAQGCARVSQRGRDGLRARVGVDYDADDEIECRVGSLKQVEGLGKVLTSARRQCQTD